MALSIKGRAIRGNKRPKPTTITTTSPTTSVNGAAVATKQPKAATVSTESEGDTGFIKSPKLTDDQERLAGELLAWLDSPSSSRFRFMGGYAGTGKTFSLMEITRRAVDTGILEREQILGVAQTHAAVRQMRLATDGSFGDYKTLASMLSLMPSMVDWTALQEIELGELLHKDSDSLTPDEGQRIESLQSLKMAHAENKVQFQPTKSLSKIAEKLADIRLIIVDEASMVPAIVKAWINELVESSHMHPGIQVLFVGDPAQLPPVGEKESATLSVERFPMLTQVVRYSGPILQYCTAVRDGKPFQSLHFEMDPDESFKSINFAMGLREASERIKLGEDVRLIASSNKAVDDINRTVRKLIHGSSDLGYVAGDVLLTKEPISRDRYDNCRPYPKKSNPVTMHCETSTQIRVKEFTGVEKFKSALGTMFTIYVAICELADTNAFIPCDVRLIDPNQWEQWNSEQSLMADIARSAYSKGKKNSRGQEGDRAKKAWELLDIQNWHTDSQGVPISQDEFMKLRRKLQVMSFKLRQCADNVTYSYCSTVHRVQGCSIDHIYIHADSVIKEREWGKKDGTWDVRKLTYTAASRAKKTLTFLI